jgi:hypothetical protein
MHVSGVFFHIRFFAIVNVVFPVHRNPAPRSTAKVLFVVEGFIYKKKRSV